jgi:hypothetical protein
MVCILGAKHKMSVLSKLALLVRPILLYSIQEQEGVSTGFQGSTVESYIEHLQCLHRFIFLQAAC